MIGGQFATSRRGYDAGAIDYAMSLAARGMSQQGITDATGINGETLREIMPMKRRVEYVPPVQKAARKRRDVSEVVQVRPAVRVSAHDVVRYVSDRTGHRIEALNGPSRQHDLVRARQLAMYLIRVLCPHMSLPGIGRIIGDRDHTTILHGIATIQAEIDDWNDFILEALAHFNGKSGDVIDIKIAKLEGELEYLRHIRSLVAA